MKQSQMVWLAAVIWFGLGVVDDNLTLKLSAITVFLISHWLGARERKMAKKPEQADHYER